ncbi:MAG: hypothetical protein LBD34_02885 [Puniceicoccales bacterium]|nr:hypothetical protein [Puniceicoccales bacterium]
MRVQHQHRKCYRHNDKNINVDNGIIECWKELARERIGILMIDMALL